MSEMDVSLNSKRRRRSGKKSQKISFDKEIVPKSIAQKFTKADKTNLEQYESQKKPRNKTKQKIVVENLTSINSESVQPKKPKREKKPQSEQNTVKLQNAEPEEEIEEGLHQDTEVDPSNPVVKKEESKRALQRQKHQKLLLEKKVKVDLVLQEKSLNYLSRWKHNQSEWKFEKLRQVWLQQNMFDCDRIPERFWTTVVEYFSGAKGQIRKTIIDDALTIIKQTEQVENNEEEEIEDEEKTNKVQRARDIIQSLQE